jgi:hypothetical protein
MTLVLVALVVGCDSRRRAAEGTIFSFVKAVQTEDLDALRCSLAGADLGSEDLAEAAARRQVFDQWARSRYTAYLVGRDAGGVDLGDDGIVLAKAFALGKGAYYTVESIRDTAEVIVVDTLVRFAYGDIDISGFPPGTVFYACGTPLGRIEALTIPHGAASVDAEVLTTVTVRWELVPALETGDCPERLTVARVEALPESVTSQEITWEF